MNDGETTTAYGQIAHPPSTSASDCLSGGGEMGELMRQLDWSKTPLGPVSAWSQSLRTIVSLLLRNQFPMVVLWGPQLVQLYNDAYRPIAGTKHPLALGQPASECWSEIWSTIGPMIEAPYFGRPATYSDDLPLLIDRHGFLEETHFKVAYSPVPDETVLGTGIGGVLGTVYEISAQVQGERQLRTLRDLGLHATEAKSATEACRNAAAAFAQNLVDVPFSLFYLLGDDTRAVIAASSGLGATTDATWPPIIALTGAEDGGARLWPMTSVVTPSRVELIHDLSARFPSLPTGAGSVAPRTAMILQLAALDQGRPYGILIVGLSPHRLLDEAYRSFFELAAAQVVRAIRNARCYEEERERGAALAALDRVKTAFFTDVSHELRTPLTLLIGPTEDALAAPDGVMRGADLETMHRNQLRLLKLVNAILDFSRIEAGHLRGTYVPTDLAALTADLASTFRSAIERAGLRLEVNCPPLSEPIYVDRGMWEKVVLNLLSNALKFTFEGEIALSLVENGDDVELTVRDTGTGISAADLPHLFERFYRVRVARARTTEGSGIGLALVHELIKLHDGSIEVSSTVAKGSTFVVRLHRGPSHLPAERIDSEPPPVAPAIGTAAAYVDEALRWLPNAADGEATTSPDGGDAILDHTDGARILVADDNGDMRDYLRRTLSQRWRVDLAADGKRALELARKARPDLILTDVLMPELDGFDLLRAVRADRSLASIPLIMISARAGDEMRIEGLEAGADDYIVKPFSGRELMARVGAHLELSRLRHVAEFERGKLSGLLMNAPAKVAMTSGPEHTYELANNRFRRLLGHQDPMGRTARELSPELEGQDYLALLDEVYRTGKPHSRDEARFLLERDGAGAREELFLNFVVQPYFDGDGAVRGVSFFAFDVTEQVRVRKATQESEQRLRLAVEVSELGDWDLNLVTGDFHRSFRHDQIFGYGEPLSSWSYQLFLEHVVPEDRAHVDAEYRAALATRGVWDFECAITHRDGSRHWIEVHGRVQPTSAARPECMLGIVADISARKVAEQERRELLAEAHCARMDAESANRAKDEFLAILGHELRNPLAPILTALQLMRLRGVEGGESERTVIERQAHHLVRLVDDLLDVSRITRGKVVLKPEHLELSEIVSKAIEIASPLIELRQQILVVDVAAHGLAVNADPERLGQVISNLLNNAAKYTEPGGRITVTAMRTADEIVLFVRDTGIGIAPEMLPKVFEMFVQERQALDRAQGGLGLGLMIVRSLVNLHGGSVDVHSDGRNRGSEFTVRLPAASALATDVPTDVPPVTVVRPANGDGKRILVVDDNVDAAEMLALSLQTLGHTTCVAHDGAAALAAVRDFVPDIALLDIGLPIMDGYELAHRLREQAGLHALPLVAITGYGQEAARRRSRAAGFSVHLVKPVDVDRVESVILELTHAAA